MGERIRSEVLVDCTAVFPNDGKPTLAFQNGNASVKVVS